MKKILITSAVLLAMGSLHAQSFTIKGKIRDTKSAFIRLYYTGKAGTLVHDSARISDGVFSFHGEVTEPEQAWLSIGSVKGGMTEKNYTSFFIEPGDITVSLSGKDLSKAVVTGSKTQEEYEALKAAEEPVHKEMEPLSEKYSKASEAYRNAVKAKKPEAELDTLKYRAAAIHDQFDPYSERIAHIDYAFFDAHPQSYVTVAQLRYHVTNLSLDSLKLFYGRLGEKVQQSAAGKELASEIEKLQAGSPGSIAKDFTADDLRGESFTLSSLKGKYVLIDFWASWCVPCRKSMPHVKELYARYKAKGFDVVAVSDDDSKPDAWKHAVEKDATGEWHNVLRGLDMKKLMAHEPNEKDISEKFGIHSLPTKILIDPQGRIIGRYDKGTDEEAEELDKTLASLIH